MVAYILYSKVTAKYYTGHTKNIEIRLQQHNSGQTVSIKSGIPWDVVFLKELETRSEAMELEAKIKSRGAKRFLESLRIL